MGPGGDDNDGRGATKAAVAPDADRGAGGGQEAAKPGRVENPHVLPCPLVVFNTTTDAETGRPLGELLRALGYV